MLHRILIVCLAIGVASCDQSERDDKFSQKGGKKAESTSRDTGEDTDEEQGEGEQGEEEQGGDDSAAPVGGSDASSGDGPSGGNASPAGGAPAGKGPGDGSKPAESGEPAVETGERGPMTVASYTESLDSADFSSAIVYYPTNSPRSQMPATTLSGGYTNTKEDMTWLAEHLASHGFVVIAFTPTTNNTLDASVWATGHKGALAKIKAESTRAGSPLEGKVDVDHLAVSGFSMGGAGTVVAVNELGSAVQASVPICAFNPVLPSAKVPSLFITGSSDFVASPTGVFNAYQGMSNGAPKAFTNFANMTHFDVYAASSPQHRNIARYMTAWYQIYLMGDASYRSYFAGPALEKDQGAGVFAAGGGFEFVE